MKKCNRCLLAKELYEFSNYTNRNGKISKRSICKSCQNLSNKKYYEENSEKEKERTKKYHNENKERISLRNKNKRLNNYDLYILIERKERKKRKSYIKNYNREYYYSNLEYFKIKKKKWRNYKKSDEMYSLKNIIRQSILKSIKSKNYTKKSKTFQILGCSYEEFKLYLESKFESWMNWENRGLYNGELNYGWDIDHIIPISLAETESELLKLNHYTNFQPLCSYINRNVKRDKLDIKL